MRRPAEEGGVELALVRRAEDHLADRAGVVVDVAQLRAQSPLVERGRAAQADLLLGREQQLNPAVRPVLGDYAPCRLEHRCHRRLVVGAENRPARVPDDPVVDHRLDRPLRRNGVEMGAEEERRPLAGRLDSAEQVADRGVDPGAGVVLVDGQREAAQVLDHLVGNGAFLPRRARHARELDEQLRNLG